MPIVAVMLDKASGSGHQAVLGVRPHQLRRIESVPRRIIRLVLCVTVPVVLVVGMVAWRDGGDQREATTAVTSSTALVPPASTIAVVVEGDATTTSTQRGPTPSTAPGGGSRSPEPLGEPEPPSPSPLPLPLPLPPKPAPPGAPAGSADPATGMFNLSWQAPDLEGGPVIVLYGIYLYEDGQKVSGGFVDLVGDPSGGQDAAPTSWSGRPVVRLDPSREYRFTVAASRDRIHWGPESALSDPISGAP